MTSADQVPFDDRGLAYGDGVFETVLLRDGVPLLWPYHRARLLRGCRVLGLEPPDDAALAATWQAPASGLEVLKIILTRGSGGRGYALPESPAPRLLSRRTPFAPAASRWQGVDVCLCTLRLARQPALAGIKHLNRLENVLARQEWQRADIAEGLLADSDGNLVEATAMNVFWLADGVFRTPPLDACGVAGTLRAALLEQGVVGEAPLSVETLLDSELIEQLFVGNSVQGVWPVNTLTTPDGEPLRRFSPTSASPLQAAAHRLLGYVPLSGPSLSGEKR
ncbi:aminodeoxychorismate lyase [Vreelandella subglaciescola]|jgi:4-amino-4-deoxychorismate lyase|uniref:Aminodeoxychorismate lyase n=1 Tax=Vreelandella subglaciescola TaxID=29571 RepID=A0A1M7F070_9GAMM|nr:aminodeoxychorismate lyase [Halomonas subglaciescola]SHL97371.1 aminodeoxychorismate lyase apoprotein [Halomonas subglaciescola]